MEEAGFPPRPLVRMDEQAPKFSLPAYYRGREIRVALSDFYGSWLLMIFYPSDFTFV